MVNWSQAHKSEVRMPQPRSVFGSLVLIAVVLAGGAAAFAYTAEWSRRSALRQRRS